MKDFCWLITNCTLYLCVVCVFWLKKPVEPDGIDNLAVVPVLLVKSMKFLKICTYIYIVCILYTNMFVLIPFLFLLVTYPQLVILWNGKPFRKICGWVQSLLFPEAGEIWRVSTLKKGLFFSPDICVFKVLSLKFTKWLQKHAGHAVKRRVLWGFSPVFIMWSVIKCYFDNLESNNFVYHRNVAAFF